MFGPPQNGPKMFLYLRQRACEKVPGSFLECYLIYNSKTNQLEVPNEALKRFETRHVFMSSFQVQDTWPHRTPGPLVHVVLVSSEAPKAPIRRTFQDICTSGIWTSFHDWSLQGGPIGPSKSTIFGVPIDPSLDFTFVFTYKGLYELAKRIWPYVDHANEPRVVYHGTAQDSVRSILADGLRPSFGMLGTAVYFGTFWKAFRFATRTQDYKKRPGAILRYYTFWPTIWYRSKSDVPCRCERCTKLLRRRGISKKEREFNEISVHYADHEGLWYKKHNYDAVMAFPIEGGPIKNTEYASPDDRYCLLESIGHAESTTEHHEPLNRNLTIL